MASTRRRALALPGVEAVLTGDDVAADGLGSLPCGWGIHGTDGLPMKEPPFPMLAQGKVRFVGDMVAFVVADTLEQARAAAEAVVVDYEVLPSVVGVLEAVRAGRTATVRRRAEQSLLRLGARRQGRRRDGVQARPRMWRVSASSTTG